MPTTPTGKEMGMTRSKYTKLTWKAEPNSVVYKTVTPAGITLTRVTFGIGCGYQLTGIASRGNVVTNYYEELNGCRATERNLVEVEGSARALAERILYKKFPEWWLTPEEYVEWREYGVCEEDPQAVRDGLL